MGLTTTEYCDEQLCLVDAAAGSSTIAGPLNAAKLILATDLFAPGKDSDTTSFSQPTTTSFNPPTLTWSPAARDFEGDIVTVSDTVMVQSADGVPYTIFGYGVTDPTGAHLLFSEVFDTPQPLADAFSFFNMAIPFCPAKVEQKGALVTS